MDFKQTELCSHHNGVLICHRPTSGAMAIFKCVHKYMKYDQTLNLNAILIFYWCLTISVVMQLEESCDLGQYPYV